MGAILLIAWGPYIGQRLADWLFVRSYVFPHGVYEISVGDTSEGNDVRIAAKGGVLRDFRGSYVVQIRTYPERQTVCTASDSGLPYEGGNAYRDSVTLAWWANNGECSGRKLAPGQYVIVTTYTDHIDHPRLPDPTHTVESNAFRVAAVSQDAAQNAVRRIEELEAEIQELREK